MDNTLPLSTLVLQPWNPLAFDHAVERTWRPVIIFLPVVVILLNSIVVLTAAFNAKLRMEIALFAWNGLFFFMCVGNVLYAACVVGFEIKLSWAEQWEQVGCSQIAAINVFFVSFDMFISLCLTTERIFMVIFVRRMSPALVFWCAGLAVVLSAGNSFVSQLQSPFIFGSGLSCAVPYPLALGIFDMIVIATTLVLLIVGNTICIWRLRQMSLTTSVPLTMVDTHLSAAHKTTSFLENGPTPLLAQRNNAERRIQRQFTIRGILAALSCGFVALLIVPPLILTHDA
ncbi:hypothetical protein BC828DRAFT_378315 [Blastocladiella britannica]|nr:hypothetical protein BC828DRAFT_378315 [Blastocladiella britannica]